MTRACSKCGKPGHNARTCGASTSTTVPAKRAVAPKPAPASPEPVHFGSVAEQLRARRSQLEAERERLVKEIATIDRVLPDIESLGGES